MTTIQDKLKHLINEFALVSLKFTQKFWFLEAASWPQIRQVSAGTRDHIKQPGEKFWPKIFLTLLLLYLDLKLAFYIWFQFNYGAQCIRLYQLQNSTDPLLSLTPLAADQVQVDDSLVVDSQLRARAARSLLKSFGSCWPELHLVNVGVACILIIIPTSLYLNYQILVLFKLLKPFDMYILRACLMESAELEFCRSMAKNVVARFKQSSAIYIMNLASRRRKLVASCAEHGEIHLEMAYHYNDVRLRRAPVRGVHEPGRAHLFICRRADQMLAGGRLIPINRSAAWIRRSSLRFGLISMLVGYNFLFHDTLLIFGVTYFFGYLEVVNLVDVLLLLEVLVMIIYAVIAPAQILATFGSNVLDQRDYLRKVVQDLVGMMRQADELFAAERWRHSERELEQMSKQLNENLLARLLEIHIFTAQFEPTRQSFRFIMETILITIAHVYIMMRFFLPYMSPAIRYLAISFSIAVLLIADVVIVPICQINHLGVKLYRTLVSSLAKTIHLNELVISSRGRPLYLGYLVWLQRQMTSDMHQFTSRFAAFACGQTLPMTWLNLLKIELVLLLLIGSTFVQVKTWRTLAGSRMEDPLGLLLGGRELDKALESDTT